MFWYLITLPSEVYCCYYECRKRTLDIYYNMWYVFLSFLFIFFIFIHFIYCTWNLNVTPCLLEYSSNKNGKKFKYALNARKSARICPNIYDYVVCFLSFLFIFSYLFISFIAHDISSQFNPVSARVFQQQEWKEVQSFMTSNWGSDYNPLFAGG